MKTLIFVRHAHRDKSNGREIDNGLSEKGIKQAQAILQFYQKLYPGVSPDLASSPKQRCLETLLPIAKKTKTEIEILPCLDEGSNLKKKFKEFLAWWRNHPATLTITCSHGDWIPAFVEHTTGAQIKCSKACWIELEGSTENLKLITLIQDTQIF